jgi:hypothetical protein
VCTIHDTLVMFSRRQGHCVPIDESVLRRSGCQNIVRDGLFPIGSLFANAVHSQLSTGGAIRFGGRQDVTEKRDEQGFGQGQFLPLTKAKLCRSIFHLLTPPSSIADASFRKIPIRSATMGDYLEVSAAFKARGRASAASHIAVSS